MARLTVAQEIKEFVGEDVEFWFVAGLAGIFVLVALGGGLVGGEVATAVFVGGRVG